MKILPLVSVLIPTYNQRRDFLEATLNSVLAQTYANIEIVLSDNHTDNESLTYIQSLSDPRIRVVMPPQFLGMVDNFAFAADNARGDYITFLPSDDLLESDWISFAVEALEENSDAAFAFGEVAGVDYLDVKKILHTWRNFELSDRSIPPVDLINMHLPYTRKIGWLVGGVIKKICYQQIGGIGFKGINYSADHALSVRLATQGGAVYINKLAGSHRVWGANEGKTEGNRAVKVTLDLIRLYELLEEPEFDAFRPAFAEKLARVKRKQGWVVLYSVLSLQTELRSQPEKEMKMLNAARGFDPSVLMYLSCLLTQFRFTRIAVANLLPILRRFFRRRILAQMSNEAAAP